jgi:hypothetical protein
VGHRVGLDVAKKLVSTGIRSPDLLARSKSLCRLSYPFPLIQLIRRNLIATNWERGKHFRSKLLSSTLNICPEGDRLNSNIWEQC